MQYSPRSLAKGAFYAAARRLGVNALMRRRSRDELLLVCYHSVIPDDYPRDPYRCRGAIRTGVFRKQLETLASCFNPVSASDLLNWADGSTALPSSPFLVTFDDGFRNNLTHAAPELERLGIPALIHVTTGYVGTQRVLWMQELDERILHWKHKMLPLPENEPDLPMPLQAHARIRVAHRVRDLCKTISDKARRTYLQRLRNEPFPDGGEMHRELRDFLTWDDVRDLHRRGFAIGSHTVEHPILTRLSREELDRELRRSKATIERELGTECPWIAFPNGEADDVSAEVIGRVKQAGYRIGFTLTEGSNPPSANPLMLDRICISTELPENVFDAKISRLCHSANRLLARRRDGNNDRFEMK